MVLAYHHYKGLPSRNINLERLIRVRKGAYVSNPVGADVGRIEAPQISRSEDVMVSDALRIGIGVHALSCATGVGEGVSIVTERIRIPEDRARRTRRTGLRNTAGDEFISLRGIASANASVNHDRSARGATGRRGCWTGSSSGIGTDQPVTGKSEVIDETDEVVVARIDEIYCTAVAHRRHPALPMQGAILVDGLEELLGSIIHRSHIADKKATQRADVDRRTQGVVDECVCARILNRAADLSQQHRIARIPIPIWIAPNADRYRRPIHRRVWKSRRSPGDAYCANHRLTSNDIELVKPKRLEVLRSVTKPDCIF